MSSTDTEYVQAPIDDTSVYDILFKGYRLVGKNGCMTEQIQTSRNELGAVLGVPIDIIFLPEAAVVEGEALEGLTVMRRRYIRPNEWYLGNMESAQIERRTP
jgi:hypothetical protein